ncbi:hypothetical protein SETIT_7G165000v2 [Setaria italica]|uniref:Uncharacterized protein n=1 Tax=Setaria italica TaxID=4555 RepID=A0A368RWH9_SETIT|nr:hypothetical protein SETIT_7G165000v2 [Setaria italica]
MADPSIICAALQPVCGFINQAGVPGATAKHFSSFACIKRNRRLLRKAIENLQAIEKVVRGQFDLEINNLNECDPRVILWLRRVASILVDPTDQEIDRLMQSSGLCRSVLGLGKRYCLGKHIVEMLEDLAGLIEEGNQFKTFASKRLPDFVEERPRTQTFGIEPMLRDLWKSFESTDVSIIGVCGPGGVGKTTLLNTFNNELKLRGRDYQLWTAGLPWNDTEAEEIRARFLMKALRRKKFVILLDDIWNDFQLEDVGIPTPDSESTSKLILTSCSVDVCYQMDAKSLIKIEYLEKEAAWELFRSNLSTQAITAIDSPRPNNVVKEHADAIVQSCGGLPLAIKVIGRAVAGLRSPREWSLAMQATKHDIKDLDGIPKMFHKLKYSYDKLRPTQKQCFLYCTLFPEYGSINKDQLVEYWMAEELIQDLNRGHRVINSLLSACLLESCGSDIEVKMHQIIRHLGLSLAEILDLSRTSITALPLCSTLSKLKYLNLSHTLIERLPEEFWMLKKLIHLDLSVTEQLKETFDNCSKLYKLRVLNLFRSNYGIRDVNDLNIDSLRELEFLGITIYAKNVLKKLTETHPLAKSTQRLSLKHCKQMKSIHISDFTHMCKLVELYVDSCLDLKQFDAEPDRIRAPCIEVLTLARLPALQTILIGSSTHHFRNLLEITISHCHNLQNITWVLKLQALEKLCICHCDELERLVQETGDRVDERNGGFEQSGIRRFGRINGVSEEQEIHGMVEDTYKEYVKSYQNMTENGRINGEVHHEEFPKLRYLVLTGLRKLTAICNPRDFLCLENIRVEGCPRLRTLPLGQMYECPKLKQICGSYDWWERLEWNGKETMENKYFIPIKDQE